MKLIYSTKKLDFPEGIVATILDFFQPHHALPLSAVSKTWLQASKHPLLHFRKHIKYLHRHDMTAEGVSVKVGRFILQCSRLESLEIPAYCVFDLSRAPVPPPLEELHIWMGVQFREDKLRDFLSSVQPTLRSLSLQNNCWDVRDFDMSKLTYLNLSGSRTLMRARFHNVSHFINVNHLCSIEELVMYDTSLSGPPDVNDGVFASCVIGPRDGILADRDFTTKPLRINMADNSRPLPLKVYCRQCNYCLCQRVSSYMRTPPQQIHITSEIYFDDALGFEPMNLKEKELR